jgi:Ca2+-binding RTX toxin-like protein
MATFVASQAVDFRLIDVADLIDAPMKSASPTAVSYGDAEITVTLFGTFTFSGGALAGGTITGYEEIYLGAPVARIDGLEVAVSSLLQWAQMGDNAAARQAFLGGSDTIQGSTNNDWLIGYAGYDSISGGDGYDTVEGDAGQNYIRGGPGFDKLYGGPEFDDINGNEGNDVVSGQEGDDWVVGGKDDDRIWGGAGQDIVYGNLGNDILRGEAGDDLVRGGQDNDTIEGGEGNDWLSGDRGNDIIRGGAGADTFHSFAECGTDRIEDFRPDEGDRIVLYAGTQYRIQPSIPGTSSMNIYFGEGEGNRILIPNMTSQQFSENWISFV